LFFELFQWLLEDEKTDNEHQMDNDPVVSCICMPL
jgi:hypothetical protein